TISWRASFILQVLIVVLIMVLSRRIADPGVQGARPKFDLVGTILSAAGLVFVVLGILQAGTYGWVTANQNFTIGNTVVIPQGGISPVWLFVGIGALLLVGFFVWIRSRERAGKEPLLHTRMFRNRASNRALVTQLIQWFIMQGSFFVISVYLQEVHGYNAIQTGLSLTPTTIGILIAGALAGRLAQRRTQKRLIWVGFVLTIAGMILLLLLAGLTSSSLASIPGLLLIGLGVGTMLTSSVNVVQSSFPDKDQGEISGLSRSVSNLGASLGTAIAGSVLVTTLVAPEKTYPLAFITMIVFACIGLIAAILIPSDQVKSGTVRETPETAEKA
ncbi:MAG TPA: MFS transporter, partial [Ktedonobacteraceae bacterium]